MSVSIGYPVRRTRVPFGAIARTLSTVSTGLLMLVLLSLVGMRAGGVHPLLEQTGSMSPGLNPGDLLLVRSVRADVVRPGEVATFSDPYVPGRTITHRVLSISSEHGMLSFVTKGDANDGTEQWTIAPSGHLGLLVAHVSHAGAAMRPISDQKWRAVLIVLVSLISSILTLTKIWRRRR